MRTSGREAATCIGAHLDLKGEVFLEVLDNHDQEGKLDAQSLAGVCRTCDIRCATCTYIHTQEEWATHHHVSSMYAHLIPGK